MSHARKKLITLTMIRTRAITDNLPYGDLVQRGIIPDLSQLLPQYPTAIITKRYPPFIYKAQNFSHFGMFWDYAIRADLELIYSKRLI